MPNTPCSKINYTHRRLNTKCLKVILKKKNVQCTCIHLVFSFGPTALGAGRAPEATGRALLDGRRKAKRAAGF